VSRSTRAGNAFGTAVAVALGGALGAVLRVSVIALASTASLPAWLGVAIVNAIGGVAIGATFVHLEARVLRHARSRLSDSPHAAAIDARGWLLDADQTLDPVDLFRAETQLRRRSGYWVTGLLGGFTTFSSFALELFELAGQLEPWMFAVVYAATATLPLVATWAGLVLGAFTLPHRPPAPPA
jgi:fluoride ion exporter CrcB/FEX